MEGLFAGDEDRVLGEGDCYWWLRSPGNNAIDAAYVDNYGNVNSNGSNVNDDNIAVRPALWLNL